MEHHKLFLLIYLSGYAVAYLYGRYLSKKYDNEWTIGNRLLHLFFSLMSWALVGGCLIAHLIRISHNLNKPARW